MNGFGLKKYPNKDQLAMSQALKSEMQKKGAVYFNIKDEIDMKTSLYGEKNPEQEGIRDHDFYENLF